MSFHNRYMQMAFHQNGHVDVQWGVLFEQMSLHSGGKQMAFLLNGYGYVESSNFHKQMPYHIDCKQNAFCQIMNSTNMLIKDTFLPKFFSTLAACKGLLSRMNAKMIIEAIFRSKFLATLVADERFRSTNWMRFRMTWLVNIVIWSWFCNDKRFSGIIFLLLFCDIPWYNLLCTFNLWSNLFFSLFDVIRSWGFQWVVPIVDIHEMFSW